MEILTEKAFTGCTINIAFIGTNASKVRDAFVDQPYVVYGRPFDMPMIKTISLNNVEYAKLICYQENKLKKGMLHSNVLKTHYSIVVICADASSDNSWMELESELEYISKQTKSSPVKMCVVCNKGDDFWSLLEHSARKFNVPCFLLEDLNVSALTLQLEAYAKELSNSYAPKIKREFRGRSFNLKNIDANQLLGVFEAAKVDYIKTIPIYKSTTLLTYQLDKRIPKNLTNDNCCVVLHDLLNGEGRSTTDSFKYFVIAKLLKLDSKVTDDEAKDLIEDMKALLSAFNAIGLNNFRNAKTNMACFMFFAKKNGIPQDIVQVVGLTVKELCDKVNEAPKQEIYP